MGAGGGGAAGDGGRFPLEAWFWEMPICTRWWTTATVLTSALVQCQMVTPFQLFYSVRTVFQKGEVSTLPPFLFLLFSLFCRLDAAWYWINTNLWFIITVLASIDHLPLLRTILSRPALPRILPSTLCPPSRGVVWPLTRSLLLATRLRHGLLNPHFASRLYAFSRPPAVFHTGLYLVAPQPRHTAELPRPVRLHRAVPPLGPHGVQPTYARDRSQR